MARSWCAPAIRASPSSRARGRGRVRRGARPGRARVARRPAPALALAPAPILSRFARPRVRRGAVCPGPPWSALVYSGGVYTSLVSGVDSLGKRGMCTVGLRRLPRRRAEGPAHRPAESEPGAHQGCRGPAGPGTLRLLIHRTGSCAQHGHSGTQTTPVEAFLAGCEQHLLCLGAHNSAFPVREKSLAGAGPAFAHVARVPRRKLARAAPRTSKVLPITPHSDGPGTHARPGPGMMRGASCPLAPLRVAARQSRGARAAPTLVQGSTSTTGALSQSSRYSAGTNSRRTTTSPP